MITNYLSPSGFDLSIDLLPNTEFFCQGISIPELAGTPPGLGSPLRQMYNLPDQILYGDLQIDFIVDENMNNYTEVLTWLEAIGAPKSSDQYKNWKETVGKFTTDVSVIIQNSKKNPNIKFTFFDAFPTSISGLELTVTGGDVTPVICNLGMRYESFEIERIE
jgi:hypothetical protein